MSTMNSDTAAGLASLVRSRRKGLGLSIADLVARAAVSRTTIARIEHDYPSRPTAPKVAKVLVALGIEPPEARAVLHDAANQGEVLHWMEQITASAHVGLAADSIESESLWVYRAGEVTELRGNGREAAQGALRAAGWTVLVPV